MQRNLKNKNQDLTEIFYDLLNQIYWDGYAEDLAGSNPEKFNFELNEFLNNQ
jgi:hypothetical protein